MQGLGTNPTGMPRAHCTVVKDNNSILNKPQDLETENNRALMKQKQKIYKL